MATRKKASRAIVKKRTSKKSAQPVPSASVYQSELDELRAMKEELSQGFEVLKKAREDLKREQDLARINREMAAGVPPVVGESTPAEEPVLGEVQGNSQEEQERIAQEREEAREQRRLKRLEEKQRAREQAVQPASVASIEEARAKKAKPAAPEKEPVTLPMDELHKYKLTTFNRTYQDAVENLKSPLIQKYNQLLNTELQKLAESDPECVKARRDQIVCINEMVTMLDPQLPDGYAITQCLTDKGIVVAQYVPDRAGKPLPLPEELTSKEG